MCQSGPTRARAKRAEQRAIRVGGLFRKTPGQLLGRHPARQSVGLTRPEVDQIRVPDGAAVRTERRGEVVDLRIGSGRKAPVFIGEAIADPPGGATAECPCEDRWCAAPGRAALWLGGSGFRSAQIGGADLPRARAPPARTAASPAPVMIEPAATSGRSVSSRTSWRAASSVSSDRDSSSTNTPRWPPASTPWTTRASAPAVAAAPASSSEVTVSQTSEPTL